MPRFGPVWAVRLIRWTALYYIGHKRNFMSSGIPFEIFLLTAIYTIKILSIQNHQQIYSLVHFADLERKYKPS